jgi:hypothetical protein
MAAERRSLAAKGGSGPIWSDLVRPEPRSAGVRAAISLFLLHFLLKDAVTATNARATRLADRTLHYAI